jgi:DNA-binding NarL/FixJ family response regulator
VLGRFDELVATGLAGVLRRDHRVRLFASDHAPAGVGQGYGPPARRVVIVAETADRSESESSIQPGGGIVMLALAPTVPQGMMLLEAGVSCLAFSAPAEDVLAAVRLAARGGCMFVSGACERFVRPDRRERLLTRRELDVLGRLSSGTPYREIARELEIGVATVNKHARSLIQKLQASSRRDLQGLPTNWLDS